MLKISKNENSTKDIKNVLTQFKDLVRNPSEFLSAQPAKTKKAKVLLKNIYGISTKSTKNDEYTDIVLPEIVLDDMDDEQIWQQIDMRNNSIWPKLLENTSKLLAIKSEGYILDYMKKDSSDLYDGSIEEQNEICPESDEIDSDSDTNKISSKIPKKLKNKCSIVDDKFFKLSEMEEFLNQEDRREELRLKGKLNENYDPIDYFENLSEGDGENARYLEFFDDAEEEELSSESLRKNRLKHLKKRRKSQESATSETSDEHEDEPENEIFPKLRKSETNSSIHSEESKLEYEQVKENKKNEYDTEEDTSDNDKESIDGKDDNETDDQKSTDKSDDENSSNDDNDESTNAKSSFEHRQDRLKKIIKEHEENRLEEKPWQLKGETSGTGRPQNSLLEEVLEFDAATRPAPIITEETTQRLEDIIKSRIKNKTWDDVERKYKPIHTQQEFRKKLILDQEKSKKSLAQIYEQEYNEQLEKLNLDNTSNNAEKEPKQHKEIRELMKSLFTKLDALSNFHYTPKPVPPEPKIITNTPAVNMEEVAPVATSDANLLAPEEVKNRPKGDVLGKSEREKSDKKRERRKKKLHQKTLNKMKEEKEIERQKLGLKQNKNDEKEKSLKNVIKNKNVQKIDANSDAKSTYKSSKVFFSALQDKNTSNLKREAEKLGKGKQLTTKKLKLK